VVISPKSEVLPGTISELEDLRFSILVTMNITARAARCGRVAVSGSAIGGSREAQRRFAIRSLRVRRAHQIVGL